MLLESQLKLFMDLAGNAYSNKSVTKIFKLKKRPIFNPLIIHFKNLKDLKNDCNLK